MTTKVSSQRYPTFLNEFLFLVDVWSIGCIFAELLTGSILCPGRDKCDQWTKIVDVVGSPNESFISKLEESLQGHVRSMPMKEPLNFEVLFSDEVFPKSDKQFCSGNFLFSEIYSCNRSLSPSPLNPQIFSEQTPGAKRSVPLFL
jgi:serine/threonine protein kinase